MINKFLINRVTKLMLVIWIKQMKFNQNNQKTASKNPKEIKLIIVKKAMNQFSLMHKKLKVIIKMIMIKIPRFLQIQDSCKTLMIMINT